MKTFNKTSLVERINYNGRTYTPNVHISATFYIGYEIDRL